MSPALQSLMTLQALDSEADARRRRLSDLPSAEQALAVALAAATSAVDALKVSVQENNQAKRALEKDIAGVDTRLARFDDHKAAVKTNQEYTALLHEIATAKADKDSVEERLLVLMEESDSLAADLKRAEKALAQEGAEADKARTALAEERSTIDRDLARLAGERSAAAAHVDARSLALYEQLIKGRRGIAVAKMTGDVCGACHVRLRPHITQQIRRNDTIVQCDSCQRILYFVAPAATAS